MLKFASHEFHVRLDMPEKDLIAFAKVIKAVTAVRRFHKPVFGALSVAGKPYLALHAGIWQGVPFGNPEIKLSLLPDQIHKRFFLYIPQEIFGVNKMIA